MANCGFILAIIVILAFLFFLWLVFHCDDDNSVIGYDACGNPIVTSTSHEVVITPTETTVIYDNDEPSRKLMKACLDKFGQSEREIDTLSRSYIIERLCSCQDAENTYERINHLCDKLGDYLTVCYNRDVGRKYAQLKKACCDQLKSCLDQNDNSMTSWLQREAEMAQLLANSNPCLSKEFLENIRKEHCQLTVRMYKAHVDKNNMAAAVVYDSLIEKTDSYVENIISATLNCRDR